MKKLLFIYLILTLNLASAGGKTFHYKTTQIVANNFENITEIVLNVEAYCRKDCKYTIKEVITNEILEHVTDREYYLWTHVSSAAGTYKFFGHNSYRYIDQDTIVITCGYPDSKMAKKLQKMYGLEHKQPFSHSLVIWTVKRIDENHSQVSYNATFKSSNPLAGLFAGIIQQGIEDGAKQFLNEFMLKN